MRVLSLALAIALLLAAAPTVLALSDPADIGNFHGVWIGTGASADKQGQGSAVSARHIGVVIRKTKSGFDMTWKTLSREGAKRISARFVAAVEPNTFKVNRVDPPLRDTERLWSQVEGGRLVLYLSRVGDERVERVARYEHSVSGGRMTFKYTLSRGGEVLESVSGNLSRAKIVL